MVSYIIIPFSKLIKLTINYCFIETILLQPNNAHFISKHSNTDFLSILQHFGGKFVTINLLSFVN